MGCALVFEVMSLVGGHSEASMVQLQKIGRDWAILGINHQIHVGIMQVTFIQVKNKPGLVNAALKCKPITLLVLMLMGVAASTSSSVSLQDLLVEP